MMNSDVRRGLEMAAEICEKEADAYKENQAQCEAAGNTHGATGDAHGLLACKRCAEAIRAEAIRAEAAKLPEGDAVKVPPGYVMVIESDFKTIINLLTPEQHRQLSSSIQARYAAAMQPAKEGK